MGLGGKRLLADARTLGRLRANRQILRLIEEALRAAELHNCAVEPQSAQDAMKLYLDSWVALPLREAIKAMTAPKKEK